MGPRRRRATKTGLILSVVAIVSYFAFGENGHIQLSSCLRSIPALAR